MKKPTGEQLAHAGKVLKGVLEMYGGAAADKIASLTEVADWLCGSVIKAAIEDDRVPKAFRHEDGLPLCEQHRRLVAIDHHGPPRWRHSDGEWCEYGPAGWTSLTIEQQWSMVDRG